MRILAIYRHYWPDATPYASLLKAILEEQVLHGHQAIVLCGQPTYNDTKIQVRPWLETVGGVTVRRFGLLPERKRLGTLRFLNYLTFLVRSIFHVWIRKDCDVIIANAQPPILTGFALRAIRLLTGTPYILHVQDIHPESANLVHRIRPHWLFRFLQWCDNLSCRNADYLITLSKDMKRTLLLRDPTLASSLRVINNFGLNEPTLALSQRLVSKCANDDQFRVIFAGNMGRFQGLERLVEAVALLGDELTLVLTFMGAGGEVHKLQDAVRRLGLSNVEFVPYQSPDIAGVKIAEADLGIVSLTDGVSQVAYPSKTMAYATAACPILAIVEADTQIALDITSHRLGYVAKGTKPADIVESLRVAWRDRGRWTVNERRELAIRAAKLFGKAQIMKQWNDLFAEIESAQSADIWGRSARKRAA